MRRKYTYRAKLTEEEIDQVIDLYRSGKSCKDVAQIVGCVPATVSKVAIHHGINRARGGPNHSTEVRVYVDGRHRRFKSMRTAARELGYRNHESLRWAIKSGAVKTWRPDKFREHPGLDSMPTPRPFETFSREAYEDRLCKAGAKVRDKYVTIPYEKIDEYHART